MPYTTITRLAGSGEQRMLTQVAHDLSSLVELKRAVADVWNIQDINKFALEVDGAAVGGVGAVLITKENEWQMLRSGIDSGSKPVLLTLRLPPSKLAPGDLEPSSGSGSDRRTTRLEQELAVAQAQVQELRQELDRVRSTSMTRLVECIQSSTRVSSDRVIGKITKVQQAQQAQVEAQQDLATTIEATHRAAKEIRAYQSADQEKIINEMRENAQQLNAASTTLQSLAKELAARPLAETTKTPMPSSAEAGSSKSAPAKPAKISTQRLSASQAPRTTSSSFAEVD